MCLLWLPAEVRVQIYSLLLVREAPILFNLDPLTSIGTQTEVLGLSTQLLTVNKQIYEESVHLLYADNIFQFFHPLTSIWPATSSITSLFEQIGAQTRLLRHICLDFPISEDQLESLVLLEDSCQGMTCIEFSLEVAVAYILENMPQNVLLRLNAHLKRILSLQSVNVKIKTYNDTKAACRIVQDMSAYGWRIYLVNDTC